MDRCVCPCGSGVASHVSQRFGGRNLPVPHVPAERNRVALSRTHPPVAVEWQAVAEDVDTRELAVFKDIAAPLRF